MYLRIFSLVLILCCSGCQNKRDHNDKQAENHWEVPDPGTRIDQVEQRITEDKLNKAFFRVTIISTPLSINGVYKVILEYGLNKNEIQVSLPRWPDGAVLRPELKAGPKPYQCYLGFDTGDGVFHELYEITVENKNIRMRQSYHYAIQNKNHKS